MREKERKTTTFPSLDTMCSLGLALALAVAAQMVVWVCIATPFLLVQSNCPPFLCSRAGENLVKPEENNP